MGGQGALPWERGVWQAAPDQGKGSQGSCPGRGDVQTETCAGTGRRPGNAPSDLYTRTVVQRMQKEPFAQRRWGLKPSRGKGRDGMEDGEVSRHGRGRQRGSTGTGRHPVWADRRRFVLARLPQGSSLGPRCSYRGQGLLPGDPDGVALLRCAPTARTLGRAAPPGLLRPYPPPRGGMSPDPQSTVNLDPGMKGRDLPPSRSPPLPLKGLYLRDWI